MCFGAVYFLAWLSAMTYEHVLLLAIHTFALDSSEGSVSFINQLYQKVVFIYNPIITAAISIYFKVISSIIDLKYSL
jgi:hypothetical protein